MYISNYFGYKLIFSKEKILKFEYFLYFCMEFFFIRRQIQFKYGYVYLVFEGFVDFCYRFVKKFNVYQNFEGYIDFFYFEFIISMVQILEFF